MDIFTWSTVHNQANREWQIKHFAERGLDEHGTPPQIPISESEPKPETEAAPPAETKSTFSDRQKQTLSEVAQQIEMAMASDETPQGVKDCLYSIIFEASNEAGLPPGDMSLVRAAFPNIIEALPEGYGRGVYHSIQAILIYDTNAFKDFYEQRLDEKSEEKAEPKVLDLSDSPIEDLARKLSDIMHNQKLPAKIFNVIADELNSNHIDFYSPENILGNLKELSESKDDE